MKMGLIILGDFIKSQNYIYLHIYGTRNKGIKLNRKIIILF